MCDHLKRRTFLTSLAAGLAVMHAPPAFSKTYKELTWEDLIPEGVPYSELLYLDNMEMDDTEFMLPVFDEHARKYVTALEGESIKLPGFIIPLEYSGDGVTGFILAPYVGACIHVPPPPPNQLVYVNVEDPYPSDQLFDAIWVYGKMSVNQTVTDLAEAGYKMQADRVEIYEWE